MKILKNRIFQFSVFAIVIVTISFIVYSSTRQVYADDTVDMGLFNTKIAELQDKIDNLTTEINTLKETNINLNTELTNLKETDINLKNDIKKCSDDIKEIKPNINKLNGFYNKAKDVYLNFRTPELVQSQFKVFFAN